MLQEFFLHYRVNMLSQYQLVNYHKRIYRNQRYYFGSVSASHAWVNLQ